MDSFQLHTAIIWLGNFFISQGLHVLDVLRVNFKLRAASRMSFTLYCKKEQKIRLRTMHRIKLRHGLKLEGNEQRKNGNNEGHKI
jgi:hypothetical protein